MPFHSGFFSGVGDFFGGVADFTTSIIGAGLQLAPTVLPILAGFGVVPREVGAVFDPRFANQPAGQAPFNPNRGTALPGGAVAPFPTQPQINPFARNLPGAAPVGFPTGRPSAAPFAPAGVAMPVFAQDRTGFTNAGFSLPALPGIPFVDVVPQGAGPGCNALMAPFTQSSGAVALRAQPFVAANPGTGKLTWFKPAGRPILWSGDLTACKRVGKIAARARRSKR